MWCCVIISLDQYPTHPLSHWDIFPIYPLLPPPLPMATHPMVSPVFFLLIPFVLHNSNLTNWKPLMERE